MDIVILIVFAAFAVGIAALILKIVFIFFKELEKNKINENQENNNIEISENIDTKNNAEQAENNNITDDNNIVTYNRVAADSKITADSNIVTDSNIRESSDTDIINNIETDSNTEEINSNKEETDNKQPESSTKYSNYKVNHQVSIKDIQSDDVYLNVDEISTSDEITVSENAYNKLYKQEDYDKYYLGNKKIEENRKKLLNRIKDKFYASSYSKRELYLNRVNGKYAPKNRYELNILLNNEKVTLNEIDISLLSNLDNVFKNSKRQNYKGIEQWDTSKIVSMKNMFLNAEYFNEDISLWKVDRVKNMQSMFEGAVNFNQNLNSWNVLPGTKIDNMFKNMPLSENPPKWVTACFEYQNSQAFYNFQKLFITFILSIYIITVYFIPKQQFYIKYTPETKDELSMLIKTQKIPLWLINTKKITDMSWLFHGGILVDYEGIESWDVSNVENMEGMFFGVKIMANLYKWNVSKVKNMQYMFAYSDVGSLILFQQIPEDTKTYGMFRGTYLDNPYADVREAKNEFEIKYYPATQEELKKLLEDENVVAGEIDVSRVDNVTAVFLDLKSNLNCNYSKMYREMKIHAELALDDVPFKDDNVFYNYKTQTKYSEFNKRLKQIKKSKFYDELCDIKRLKHDDYAGIEYWKMPDMEEMIGFLRQ